MERVSRADRRSYSQEDRTPILLGFPIPPSSAPNVISYENMQSKADLHAPSDSEVSSGPESVLSHPFTLKQSRPRPSLVPIAVAGCAILGSVTAIPYVVIRRRLALLHGQIAQAATTNAALRRDVQSLLAENSIRRGELQTFMSSLEATRASVDALKEQVDSREDMRGDRDTKIREGLQEVLETVRRAEVDAVKRYKDGAEWSHSLANNMKKFGWWKSQ